MTGSAGPPATSFPHIVAPASGRLVNANERIAPPDFPVFLGRDWFGDWRARRIRELLDRSDRHTAADFARMQVDVHSNFARQILPALLAVPVTEDAARRAQVLLQRLGRQHGDGPAAAADLQRLGARLLWPRAATGRHRAPATAGRWPSSSPFVLSPAGAHWCGGDCTATLQASLADAGARPDRAASATIPPHGAGARRIRRCSPIRCCAPLPVLGRARHAHASPAPATTPRSTAAACVRPVPIGARGGVSRRV